MRKSSVRKSSVIPTKRPAVNKTAAAIKEILSQFSFWCSACETNGDLVYRNRPEYNGMTSRYYNKRRMVLECGGCGAVHAERKGKADDGSSACHKRRVSKKRT